MAATSAGPLRNQHPHNPASLADLSRNCCIQRTQSLASGGWDNTCSITAMLAHIITPLGVFLTILSARAVTADFTRLMDKSRFARQSPIEGCQLPDFPPNGSYTTFNYGAKQIIPGDVVSSSTILTYSCEEGFHPMTQFSSCQENNTWSAMPECYQCGLEKALGITLSINSSTAMKDTFPWHVAIFQDKGGPVPENICGGSLVRAGLVISAAHCFYDPVKYVKIDDRYYKVACGKFYRSWDNANDSALPYVQRSELKRIILPESYGGDEQNHRNDLSILVLATPFRLSDSVRPVCIDLVSEELDRVQVEPGKRGKVAGWGVTEEGQPSELLRSLELPVVGIPECRVEMNKYRFTKYLTSDKLCAGYTNGSALCLGDSGGGLVFPDFQQTTNTTRWYLRGIVSNAPVNKEMNSCQANTYTAFTNIFKLRSWLHNQLRLLTAPAEGCRLPDFPSDGGYSVYNYGAKKIVPGDVVSLSTTLAYFCKKDFEPTTPFSSCQENNIWSAMPECIGDICVYQLTGQRGVCIPLTICIPARQALKNGISPQTCSFQGVIPVVCCPSDGNAAPPPAEPSLSSTNECPPIPADAVKVQPTGQKAWDKCIELAETVFPCVSASVLPNSPKIRLNRCNNLSTPLIVGGSTTAAGEFPHMALLGFANQPDKPTTDIRWHCGGTLISDRWVMSSSSCTFRRADGYVRFVRLGGDDSNTVLYTISKLVPHPDVYNDIVLLELDRKVVFSDLIRPACLHTGQPISTTKAIATGWGMTRSTGERSDSLLKVTLEIFPHDECALKNPPTRRYKVGIRNDTELCAGHRTEAKDTCQGDSGGPLQVYNDGSVYCTYLIIGVTSHGRVCGVVGLPAVYTRVSAFVPWIESVVWP